MAESVSLTATMRGVFGAADGRGAQCSVRVNGRRFRIVEDDDGTVRVMGTAPGDPVMTWCDDRAAAVAALQTLAGASLGFTNRAAAVAALQTLAGASLGFTIGAASQA